MTRRIRLIFTGITPAPTAQIHRLLRAEYPDAEIEAHVVTWAGMNGEEFFRVFDFATIHELDPARFRPAIDAAIDRFALKATETVRLNTVSMFCCWNEAAQLAEQGGADIVVKARVDNSIAPLPGRQRLFEPGDALRIPEGGNFRNGVGDHVCYGPAAEVAATLRLFQHLPSYAAEGYALHPERLVALHTGRVLRRPLERSPLTVFYRDGIYNADLRWDGTAKEPSDLRLSLADALGIYRHRNTLAGGTPGLALRVLAARLLRSVLPRPVPEAWERRLRPFFAVK